MAEFVLTDAFVSINSVDLSDHVKRVAINYEAEILDKTAMGDTARTKLAGLKNWTAEVEFHQDFAASNVDATLFPLVGAAAFPVEFRPTSAAASATNPKFTGNALLSSYPPIGGAIGEVLMASASLDGDGALTRATS